MSESHTTPKTLTSEQLNSLETLTLTAVVRAVGGIALEPTRFDPDLGTWQKMGAFIRSLATVKGGLCETVLRRVLETQGHMRVLPAGIALPLLKSADDVIGANEWADVTGISIDTDSLPEGSYKPDIIVYEPSSGRLWILEIKRRTNTYAPSKLAAIMRKLKQAALAAPDFLYRKHGKLKIREVGIAIIDCDDSDEGTTGVRRLSDMTNMFALNGFDEVMDNLNDVWRTAVQERLDELVPLSITNITAEDPVNFSEQEVDGVEPHAPISEHVASDQPRLVVSLA